MSSLNFQVSSPEPHDIPDKESKKELPTEEKKDSLKQLAKTVETGHGDVPIVAPPSAAAIKEKKVVRFSEDTKLPDETAKAASQKGGLIGTRPQEEAAYKKIQELNTRIEELEHLKKSLGSDKGPDRDAFNEKIFECSKEVMLLKKKFPKKSTPPELRGKITALDLKLIELNPRIPLASDIVKAFPETDISSLHSAASELSGRGRFTPFDINRDKSLLGCSPNEVICLYAKRVVKAARMAEAENAVLKPFQIKTLQRNIKQIEQNIEEYNRILNGEVFDPHKDLTLSELSKNCSKAEITKFKTDLEKDLAEQTKLLAKIQTETPEESLQMHLSFVTALETLWEDRNKNPSADFAMHEISGKKVLFVPKDDSKGDHILIESTLFGQGTSSAYVGLISYHQVKKMHPKEAIGLPGTTSRLVFRHAFDEEFGLSQKKVKETEKKSEEKSSLVEIKSEVEEDKGSFVVKPDIEGPKADFKADMAKRELKELNLGNIQEGIEKAREKQRQVKAAQSEAIPEETEEKVDPEQLFSGLPGTLKLTKVVTIEGEQGVIKPAAGYVIGGNQTKVVDLEGMKNNANKLSKKDQIMFIRAMGGVLLGTKSLHDRDWVHRDEKLLNALIMPNGEGKLTDFDISCRSGSPELERQSGTPIYMAPEACAPEHNKGKIGKPVDIWSLGMMLWEMGSGKNLEDHPAVFNPGSRGVFRRGLLSTDTEMQKKYAANYPEPPKETLAHLVWEMTRIDPSTRPTIDQVRERFNAWAQAAIAWLQSEDDPNINISDAFGGLPPSLSSPEKKK